MVYIYCRKSTEAQNDTSFEVQEDVVKRQINNLSITDEIEVVKETGSGKDVVERPKMMNILNNLKSGDIIAIYDNSRLSRNLEVSTQLLRKIYTCGARLLCNGKFVDPTNPQDNMLFNLDSVFSAYQRQIQNQKSVEGTKRKYENGDAVFTGKILGYSSIKKGSKVIVSIVDDEAKIVRYIYNETIKGRSIVSIAKELWDTAITERKFSFYTDTVRAILRRPLYMGYYSLEKSLNRKIQKYTEEEIRNSLVKSNYYPAIIDEETWWKCYRTWKQNVQEIHRIRFTPHELTGIYRCSECGYGLTIGSKDKRIKNETAIYSLGRHKINCKFSKINFGRVWLERLTRLTFYTVFMYGDEVGEFFKEREEQLYNSNKELLDAINICKIELGKLEKKKSNIVDAIADGIITVTDARNKLDSIKDEMNKYTDKMDALDAEIRSNNIEADDFVEVSANEALEFFDTSATTRRTSYSKYIKSALVYRDCLEVEYFNGKHFRISRPRRYRNKIEDAEIIVSYKGQEQLRGFYNYVSNKITLDTSSVDNLPLDKEVVEYLHKDIRQKEELLNNYLNSCCV